MKVVASRGPRHPSVLGKRRNGQRFELFENGVASKPTTRRKRERRYRYVLIDHDMQRVVAYYALKRTAERDSGLQVSKRKFPPRWMAE